MNFNLNPQVNEKDRALAERKFLAETETEEEVIERVSKKNLAQFTQDHDKCQGIQLPKGVMLRYNLAESLFFYLETMVDGGKIRTSVFASSTPYAKENRVLVGEIATPIFDPGNMEQDSNALHSGKVEQAVTDWVAFVSPVTEVDESRPFTSFAVEREKG